jgi:hypothetical protein
MHVHALAHAQPTSNQFWRMLSHRLGRGGVSTLWSLTITAFLTLVKRRKSSALLVVASLLTTFIMHLQYSLVVIQVSPSPL